MVAENRQRFSQQTTPLPTLLLGNNNGLQSCIPRQTLSWRHCLRGTSRTWYRCRSLFCHIFYQTQDRIQITSVKHFAFTLLAAGQRLRQQTPVFLYLSDFGLVGDFQPKYVVNQCDDELLRRRHPLRSGGIGRPEIVGTFGAYLRRQQDRPRRRPRRTSRRRLRRRPSRRPR